MKARDILNNTDPYELRNILYRLRQQQSAFQTPPLTEVTNENPEQFPSTTSETVSEETNAERYLAVYNYILFDGSLGTAPSGYQIGLATSSNEREWTIQSEPVIPLGTAGQWDSYNHQFPHLLDVNGVLYLYFSGKDGFTWTHFKIGVARSFDRGETWEMYASNPILNNNITWENSVVFSPVVLYDREETNSAKRWKMWYGGSSFGQGIGYAYSADGLSWTKFASNPVLTLGASGQWDDTYLYPGAVIRRGNGFILFYGGHDGSAWASGYATFTDPEGTYTKSSNNPIIAGDGITTTLTADLVEGDTSATVADATIFPIGCPVWIGTGSVRFLTHVAQRLSATSLEIADPAPNTVSSGGIFRSVAYGSVNITNARYDDGYKFNVTPHQPDGLVELGVHELSMLAYANDELVDGFIDYGAGILMPVTVVESQNENITRENVTVLDTYDQEANRHKPAFPQSLLDTLYALLGHVHSGGAQSPKLAQANTHESPDTDSATSALHHTLGTGANQAAAGDHSHGGGGQYRQLVWDVVGDDLEFLTEDGEALYDLVDLE